MLAPEGYQWAGQGRSRGLVRADLATSPLELWWGDGELLAGAKGRGSVRLVRTAAGDVVVRGYRRGGWLSGLVRELYLDGARSFRELAVLATLSRRGVPVAVPVAAVRRRRFCIAFTHRLATELVDAAAPLPGFVARHPGVRSAAVREAGRVVRLGFDHGLIHPDLHPDNLLARLDGARPQVVLIDLDRARLRSSVSAAARDKMLLRFARYVASHAAAMPTRASRSDHLRFLAGGGYDRAARRAVIDRLTPAYERALRRYRRRAERGSE